MQITYLLLFIVSFIAGVLFSGLLFILLKLRDQWKKEAIAVCVILNALDSYYANSPRWNLQIMEMANDTLTRYQIAREGRTGKFSVIDTETAKVIYTA